jgi:hypothetical protein
LVFANDDSARFFHSRDKERILVRHEISEPRIPEGGRQSSDIERLPQRYGDTELNPSGKDARTQAAAWDSTPG